MIFFHFFYTISHSHFKESKVKYTKIKEEQQEWKKRERGALGVFEGGRGRGIHKWSFRPVELWTVGVLLESATLRVDLLDKCQKSTAHQVRCWDKFFSSNPTHNTANPLTNFSPFFFLQPAADWELRGDVCNRSSIVGKYTLLDTA